jgi:hypothetical protein
MAALSQAGTITASLNVTYGGCSDSVSASGQSVNVAATLDSTSCPSVGHGPYPTLSATMDALSGGVLIGGIAGNCDQLLFPSVSVSCSGSISLDGDYFFSGSGTSTFNFGTFSIGAGSNVFPVFKIDGVGYQALGSPTVTLQLGTTHHITYSAQILSGSQNSAFGYVFDTPGIGIAPVTLTPEPSVLLLCGAGLLVVGMRKLWLSLAISHP